MNTVPISIYTQLREQVQEAIEAVLEVGRTAGLESARHERTERRAGYRHGVLERTIATPLAELKATARAALPGKSSVSVHWPRFSPALGNRSKWLDRNNPITQLAGIRSRWSKRNNVIIAQLIKTSSPARPSKD